MMIKWNYPFVIIIIIDGYLNSAILRSQADSLRSHVIQHEWLAFYSIFLYIHQSGCMVALGKNFSTGFLSDCKCNRDLANFSCW